ncbi:hypothetical protein KHA96_07265 [Bacillus sp. FJAT-49711]|uniref:hypothetical protein n=1 Tax=Bacillus sp. FJAT-49711 TaxID=2833585 RepID=UPI001BC99E82|nr:hypothetical protein [Bacillus sp. FJAT-49711]MBS4218123.1 hypothetical protein [Bacillus sp. FJAT-49711]
MKGVSIFFIIIGIMLLIGMFYYFSAYQRPGIYPPKKILRNRVASLGGAGLLFLLIGILITILIK